MNAREALPAAGLVTPEFLLKHDEPAALFSWWSSKRLLVMKEDAAISLSADDLLALLRFLRASGVEDQL